MWNPFVALAADQVSSTGNLDAGGATNRPVSVSRNSFIFHGLITGLEIRYCHIRISERKYFSVGSFRLREYGLVLAPKAIVITPAFGAEVGQTRAGYGIDSVQAVRVTDAVRDFDAGH